VRCIKCNVDNKLKERQENSGRCKGCRHPYAFDPKITPGVDFTDKFFQQSLSALSAGGSLYFTPRQLYYFINRRLNARRTDPANVAGYLLFIGGAVLSVLLFLALPGFWFLWLIPLLLAAGFGAALMVSPGLRRRLYDNEHGHLLASQGQVEGWYVRWLKLNDESFKMLPPPATGRRKQPAEINPEVLKYSFDRVVVCDRYEIAQCLIANNFHFEHNCAVLSLDGHPHDIFEAVMQMLRRNPDLSVYALHDASPLGVELPHILRTDPRWFAGGGAKVYDLGLLPRQVFKRPVFVERGWQRARGESSIVPPHVAAALEPAEVRWLEEGKYVTLESFTPKTLLRVVAQGIAKSRDPRAADALVPVTVGGDGGGGGMLIYTTDSFG
jgi:hypothetical protein